MVTNAVRRRNNDKLDWISNQSRLNLYSCVSPVMVYSTSQVLMLNIFEIKKMHFMNYEANIICTQFISIAETQKYDSRLTKVK